MNNDLPDHAQALVELLEQAAKRIREGESAQEVADSLVLPIRIAARRI